MEVRPPYLIGDGDPLDAAVTVVADISTDSVEMTIRGRWDQRLGMHVFTSVGKCLAGHPAALIVDVAEMDDFSAASTTMWLAVNRRAAAMVPPVRLVLCVPPAAPLAGKLNRVGASRSLAVVAGAAQARAALAVHAVLTDRMQLGGLPPEPESASAARNLVGEACDAWNMRILLHPSRLIVSELASNAVEHARTPMLVSVGRRANGLLLSIRDGDPRLPYLRDLAPPGQGSWPDDRGRGLRIVDATATAWGAMPTRDGKLVWATVRDNSQAHLPA